MKEEINLVKILEIVLKLWWFVLICAIVVGIIGFSISSFLMTPMYTSTAKVYVEGSSRNTGEGTTMSDLTTNTRLVSTYIEILCTDTFLSKIASESNYNVSSQSIKSNISMNSCNETEVLEIKYADVSPEQARDILQILLNYAQKEIPSVMNGCRVNILDNASLPKSNSSPNTKQNTFIGLFIGIVIGVAIIFIKELLDTRIKDEDDLRTRYNLSVLGVIPNLDED